MLRQLSVAALCVAASLSTAAFAADAVSGASANRSLSKANTVKTVAGMDAITSASIVPKVLRQMVRTTGFTADKTKKKVLIVAGDPRLDSSMQGELVKTAVKFFQEKGCEVVLRDLYKVGFNPVITAETFWNAKDGYGKTPADIVPEQKLVKQADWIVFAYPNWHDTPNPMVKGYMERVFAKKFAYRDTKTGLEGLLKGKAIYTIMNAGWLGGGQGNVGDGIGQHDAIWDKYMNAYKVLDDDTAGFWGLENYGRFVNDQTPANLAKDYKAKLDQVRNVLRERLERDFFNRK